MRFRKLSLLMVVAFVSFAHANEEKKEGAAGEAAGAEDAGAKDEKEYREKSAKLSTLANKISEADKHFTDLVHEKNETKNVESKQQFIKEMLEVNVQRNKDVDAYNKLRNDVELRYPGDGERSERRYETQEKRSIEEMEGVAGLDELLTRTKKVVEKKYAPFQTVDAKKGPRKKLAAQPDDEEEPRLRLEK